MTRLIDNLPKHDFYIELFSGKKSLLFEKLPLTSEVYNDYNKDIVNFFEVIKKNFKEFVHFLKTGEKTDGAVHIEKWDRLKELYDNFSTGSSFKVNFNSLKSFRDISSNLDKELKNQDDKISNIIKRIRMVQLESRRFDDLINRFDKKEAIFYVDVTELPEDVTHNEVIDQMLNLKGKGILYGANCSEYETLIDEGWMKVEGFPGELVWINYRV